MLFSNEQIERRIAELGYKIGEDYRGLHPVFIIVLNGAFMFAASLLKSVRIPCEANFIKLSSYSGMQSTGEVSVMLESEKNLAGRDLIIVEDIVDTGRSMRFLIDSLTIERPRSIRVATLLFKPGAVIGHVHLDYVGFEIENRFVVGYGLDYDGLGRNYPDIYVRSEG